MANMISGSDFLKALAEGSANTGLYRTGMAKSSKDDASFMFSEGRSCKSWVRVPLDMVEGVEVLDRVPCADHEHPYIKLHFKSLPKENKEAAVLLELLRTSSAGKSIDARFRDSMVGSPTFLGMFEEAPRHREERPAPTREGTSELQARPSTKDQLAAFSFMVQRAATSQVPSIPSIIGNILAEEYAIDQVTGGIQCAGAIQGILDNYDTCVNNGGSPEGCARNAAKQIRNYACRSYCNCE